MEKVTGLMRHMSNTEREHVQISFEVMFIDAFDALEVAWSNMRFLEKDFRALLYGEELDPRDEVEKTYQAIRDLQKSKRS